MSRGPRLSKAQRDELWCRWRAGESGRSIARALRVSPAAVRYVVAPTGGISPRVRHRATTALTLEERETISRSLAAGASLRSIARVLGRCASTVSREVARNGGRAGYRAVRADQRALDAALAGHALRVEMRAVLTPEQQVQSDQLREEFKTRHQRRMMHLRKGLGLEG